MKSGDEAWIYEIERPHRRLLYLYALHALCTGPLFPLVFIPLFCKYLTLKYRFDDQGVLMSWGVLWRREIFLTYTRIQDIHLSRGLIERWFKIATINVQTASGSAAAEMSIVGMQEYEAIRDFLYSRMRGANLADDEKETDWIGGFSISFHRSLTNNNNFKFLS